LELIYGITESKCILANGRMVLKTETEFGKISMETNILVNG
jgi:hypothetical protein